MELFRNLSDNELAVVGCLGALAGSFVLMCGSYHFGRIMRARQADSDPASRPQSIEQQRPSTGRRAA